MFKLKETESQTDKDNSAYEYVWY